MSGGTLFSSEYCPGGQYSRGDIIHSDNVIIVQAPQRMRLGIGIASQPSTDAINQSLNLSIHSGIMKSCFEGKLEELRPLLAGNYQLRARDERGRTLLHVAAGSGQKKVLQHLLDLVHPSVDVRVASTPGSLGGGKKRAWYTLSAHASKFT